MARAAGEEAEARVGGATCAWPPPLISAITICSSLAWALYVAYNGRWIK